MTSLNKVLTVAVSLLSAISLAQSGIKVDLEDDGEDHAHYVDPSMDGSCTACIGARRIYCLDGSGGQDGNGNPFDFTIGSCQPSWAYCTSLGKNEYWALMNYRECKYTPVQSPALGTYFQDEMIDLVITDEMAQKVKNGEKYTMLDFLFLPNQLQFVRVTIEDDVSIDVGLYFDGIFDVHKHEAIENDPRIVNQIDLNVLKVYFSDREPSKTWGYPSQLDDLYEDRVIPASDYSNPFYVTISNPSTYYY